jgi:dolichol-phosphate mannosyltransferase
MLHARVLQEQPVPAVAVVPDLTIVIPTRNEVANIEHLVSVVDKALAGQRWEIIFVDDDSPDGTSSAARQLGRTDPRVRCVQRIGRRGLASACIEGMLASNAPFIAVMDADLQHDESILPKMLDALRGGEFDLVIGTRYAAGGSVGEWDRSRQMMSRLATRLSHAVCRYQVSDPMSGFFMLKRELLDSTVRGLSAIGFKILLDILATARGAVRICEVPYTFRARYAGESKLDGMVLWEYGMLLADKMVGRYVPVRFLAFALVGALGVLVHLATLSVLYRLGDRSFAGSQAVATVVAMTFNFAVNNVLTYRDRRLRGFGWFKGLATFMLACGVGGLANVGIATYLFEHRTEWVLAALAGILVGAVWNYAVTQLYTWRGRR